MGIFRIRSPCSSSMTSELQGRPYDKIAETGFTADYVYREPSAAGRRGRHEDGVLAGIDIDVATPGGKSKSTPENVRKR